MADEGGGEGVKGCPDVLPALIAHRQAAEAGEPGQGSLDDLAMAPQAVAAVDPVSSNAGLDAACATGPAATGVVVSLVGVQLARAPAGTAPTAPQGRNRIQGRREPHAGMQIGRAEKQTRRHAVAVRHKRTLGARLAPVHRARARRLAPFLAGTLALSGQARLQSMRPASCSRRNVSACSWPQTPAARHSPRRRQQLTPEPKPSSRGSVRQGMPDFSTNRMPDSTARSSRGRRPPFGRGLRGGGSGATLATDHQRQEVPPVPYALLKAVLKPVLSAGLTIHMRKGPVIP